MNRHTNLFGPVSSLPLVGLGSLAVQPAIESVMAIVKNKYRGTKCVHEVNVMWNSLGLLFHDADPWVGKMVIQIVARIQRP
jgi:hypothetical protein